MVKPRLGHIHFLNVLPITYSLNNLNYKEGLELSNGVPAVINNDLLNNRVDVSEVSSIVYARNYDKLLMLPDLCVRADGEVRSIILVSKKPIEEINEDKIIPNDMKDAGDEKNPAIAKANLDCFSEKWSN